jgi:hypothetical protein
MSPSLRRRWRGLVGAALDAALVFTIFALVFGAFSLANSARGLWHAQPEPTQIIARGRT